MTKQFDPKLVQSLNALRTLGPTFPGNPMGDAGTNHTHPISAVVGLSDALSTLSTAITTLNSNLNSIATRISTAETAITALQQGGAVGQIPGITVMPTITGTAAVGQTLSVSTGSWSGSPSSFAYQWKRAGSAISGATTNTYILALADAGSTITCSVSATNASGTGTVTTLATSAVTSTPGNTGLPTITGTAAVGQTLSVSTGSWTGSPTGYAYQWTRDGANISGATSNAYVLVSTDASHSVAAIVTATNAQGSSAATSASVSVVDIPSMLVAPSINGAVVDGQVITASPGTWTGSPTFTYQWNRAGSVISGATSQAYTVQTADVGQSITITVTATNAAGNTSATSAGITAGAAGQTAAVASNPVTTALTGLRTFNVGTGQTYPDPDTVPWGALVAGDVVNIFYRATPYAFKIGLRGQGTSTNPIVINGVTDSNGNRPIFDFAGSKTAAGCNPSGGYTGATDVFGDVPAYSESLGGITVIRGPVDKNNAYNTYKPTWIKFQNLEVRGARSGATYTALNGTTVTFGSAGGFYFLYSADCSIDNCVIYDNAFGVFTMANNNLLFQTNERFKLRNSRIYGNGVPNSWFEHGCYIQCPNPLIEGNFIGQNRPTSQGSSYKDRSSALVFRYNYVQASARAIDMVHSEDNNPGISTQSDYGTDFVYGNVIENNWNLPNGGSANGVHYGGDNLGEDSATGTLVTPSLPYRKQCYFFGNTYIIKCNQSQYYKPNFFQLSLVGTKLTAWNNLFVVSGNANFALLGQVGQLELDGSNLAYGTIANVSADATDPTRYSFVNNGTLLTGNPNLIDMVNGDYRLNTPSPAIDATVALPTGSTIATVASTYPVQYQPNLATNGLVVRSVQGTAFDIGALEYGLGTGLPPSQPANTSLPVISGTPVNGNTLTTSNGSWSGSPTAYTYQWKRAGANISNATSSSYVLTGTDVGNTITVVVTASNVVGSASATSAGVTAVAANLPANTTAPAITGTAQSGQTVTCSSGTWTNTPSSYAYQWNRAGSAISGATSSSYLLQAADIGQAITCVVTATNVNGSTPATSNTITPSAGALEPDVNGVFTFNEANGTSLTAINNKWTRNDGNTTAIDIECQNNMAQCKAGTGYNGAIYVYQNGQAAEQSSKAKVASGFVSGADIFLVINDDGTNRYSVDISAANVQFRKNGTYIDQQPHGINLSTTAAVFELKRVGTSVTVSVNGTTKITYTDSTPLTTGFPGFSIYPASATVTNANIDSWTDNTSATLP